MQLRVIRTRTFAVAAILLLAGVIGSSQVQANCQNGSPITWSGNAKFTGCGTNAEAFFWANHLAVQRKSNGNTALSNTAGGVDSGNYDGTLLLIPGAQSGDYQVNTDWGVVGADACVLNADIQEADGSNCVTGGAVSTTVTNFMITGKKAGNPVIALTAVVSVDYLEAYSNHDLAQAGAPSVDGSPCFGADCDSWTTTNVTCTEIPIPKFASVGTGCSSAGCTYSLSIPATAVPIVDDCVVAFSRGIDCPRNLDGGFQLMAKRNTCTSAPADTRIYTGLTSGASTVQVATNNWFPYAPQDLNLNGVQDGGEVAFVPVIFSGAAETKSVFVPAIPLQADCLYFGLAKRVDPNAVLALAIQHEPVFSNFVTMNTNPVHVDTATPAADRVINLMASKSSGKAGVSWDTSAEFSTAGFNLIGTKKNGGTIQLNSSLIQAKNGTTGEGASYNVSLGGADLKGSTAVYVELVKTNGAKERFGPASF